MAFQKGVDTPVMSPHRTRGLTLVELLVVIVILAVLAGLIFPVFSSAKKRAKKTTCFANLRSLHQAFTLYAGDWEDRAPIAYNGPVPVGGRYFGEFLTPLLKSRDVLKCPEDRFWPFEMIDRPKPRYPTHFQEDGGSYAYNGRDLGRLGTLSAAPAPAELSLVWDTVPYHTDDPTGPINTAFFDGHVKPVLWHDRMKFRLPDE